MAKNSEQSSNQRERERERERERGEKNIDVLFIQPHQTLEKSHIIKPSKAQDLTLR